MSAASSSPYRKEKRSMKSSDSKTNGEKRAFLATNKKAAMAGADED
jgi:hypothetical protein